MQIKTKDGWKQLGNTEYKVENRGGWATHILTHEGVECVQPEETISCETKAAAELLKKWGSGSYGS